MVKPREEFLGAITLLDENSTGSINANNAEIQNINGVIYNSRTSVPTTGADKGVFWVEDGIPTLPKFTNSAGTTITLGQGAVTSVFTRTGAVTAQSGDYNTSQITNSSTLAGTTLNDVLNSLGSSDIANESSITGLTISNALDNLFTTISSFNLDGYVLGPLGSDDIANESTVFGTTVSDALQFIFEAISSTHTLAQVLTAGNETGSNWIEINDTFGIRGQAEGSSFTISTLDAPGISGNLIIETGNSDITSGNLIIQTGDSADISGNILIQTKSSSNFTGDITIFTQEAGQTSGNITVQTSNSDTSSGWILLSTGSAGPILQTEIGDGYINIYAANGNSFVEGGEINVIAGNGGAHKGGDLNLRSGVGANADAGNINITSGGGGMGNAGGILVTTGVSGTGNAGDFIVTTGNSAGGRAGRMLFSLGSGTGNNVSFITIKSDSGTINEKFRFGAYGTLSFFEHADPDGEGIGWLPTPQTGETALFRRHEALVYWDDTNNLYTELTDREIQTVGEE